jgi:hypothetical protein
MITDVPAPAMQMILTDHQTALNLDMLQGLWSDAQYLCRRRVNRSMYVIGPAPARRAISKKAPAATRRRQSPCRKVDAY